MNQSDPPKTLSCMHPAAVTKTFGEGARLRFGGVGKCPSPTQNRACMYPCNIHWQNWGVGTSGPRPHVSMRLWSAAKTRLSSDS